MPSNNFTSHFSADDVALIDFQPPRTYGMTLSANF
jgi:hypothetical protein